MDRSGEGLAVERQREDSRKLVTQRGWSLVAEFVDNDTSAAGRKPRPQFEALLHAVEAHRLDVIVAYSLDRLTRNRRDQLRLIETCQAHSTLVALVRGSDIDMSSAVGRAMADMMAVWARMEIEQKSERQIRAIQQAAEAGRMVGGRRAFGYTADGLDIDPVEGPVVARLYERFLAGASLADLARWMNDTGVRTTRGGLWAVPSVRVVLANPRNAGLRGVRRLVNERTGARSSWHDIVGKAVWPPIVEQPTWEATMAILRDPSRRSGTSTHGNAAKYLLTNIARCGTCNEPMTHSGTGRFRIIRCRFFHHARRADLIELYVEEVLLNRLSKPDAVSLLTPVGSDVDVEAARAEAVTLRARLGGLAADYAEGILDRDQMRVASERIRNRLGVLGVQLAQAGQIDPVVALVEAGEDIGEIWDSYELSTRRAVVDRLLTVRVLRGNPGSRGRLLDPSTVDIAWLGNGG